MSNKTWVKTVCHSTLGTYIQQCRICPNKQCGVTIDEIR